MRSLPRRRTGWLSVLGAPLTYRQHQTIKNSDIFLDRGHLTRVLHRTAELLEPIYESLSSSVLNSKILTADETPTPAGRNKKKGKMDKGRVPA